MLNNELKDYGSILRVSNYRETDKLLHIFLQNYGIITAFAYGAKNSKKRFGGNLEPYQLQFFNISQKKQNYILNEVKVTKLFLEIRKNLTSIEMLQNISKLLTKIPFIESKITFKYYYFLLTKLNYPKNNEDMFKAYYLFITFLLSKEGFFPKKHSCFKCESRGSTHFFVSNFNEAHFLCDSCLTDVDFNSTLVDEETSNFIKYCITSPKTLFNTSFTAKTYFTLSKILNTLIIENFHISLAKIEYN